MSRTNVGFMGCHGALNGLRVARALSLANPGEAVLVCATELCSLHHQYTDDPQQIVANSLFADGSAAVVLRSAEASDNIAGQAGWTLLGSSSCVLSESTDMMSWRVGDHGFQMTLSAQVPEVIRKQLKPWLESWLATKQLTLADIASWAVHPGGPAHFDGNNFCTGIELGAASRIRWRISRLRQHVIANYSVYSRSHAPPRHARSLCRSRVWSWIGR